MHQTSLSRNGLVAAFFLVAASASASAQSDAVAAFDQARAFSDVTTMVGLGPRPLGSDALEANRAYIETQLREAGLDPVRDEFVGSTPIGEVAMANIIARVAPRAGAPTDTRLVLASHFDTKLFDGVDFVGANDGASSTAVLLELGRVLAEHRPGLPVDLVFFDGEEAVVAWTDDDSIYGSRHLAARWQREGDLDSIGALILLDMVGDASLQIPRELNSTNWINDVIWDAARELGYEAHFPETVHAIQDDHLPFLQRGVDAVDLIDFTYGAGNRHWHQPSDTLDKLSADSLGIVGRVVLHSLPTLELLLGG
ncbi:MAG: M28 family peptidase [Acidobacteria bacterium]|nr:M28 family peptidase [Acidobacteriota bacterium]